MNFENLINNKIRENNGLITFRDYMELALYHDDFGYYRKAEPFIGKTGDFVTSPHTGPFFGALIAVQLKNLSDISGITSFNIVEMGAGHGFLARDILNYLSLYEEDFYKNINYIIIEPGPKSIHVQKNNIEKFKDKVTYYKDIKELPKFEGCFLSNELLDAFSVHLIEKHDKEFKEVGVVYKEGLFQEKLIEIKQDTLLEKYIKENIPENLPDKYRTEVNLNINSWLESVSEKLIRGFVFTIDYGYTRNEFFNISRNRGTLLCYREHQVNENYLENPGNQDITSHVNFSDVKDWGEFYNLNTVGYVEQWAFLGGLDFEETYLKLFKKIDPFSKELNAIKMLIMPHCMGATHKVIIQKKNIDIGEDSEVKGYRLRNLKYKL